MLVSEIMVRDPITVSPATRVEELARLMRDRSISSVVLSTGGKPVGIVTERDLVHRVLAEGRDPTAFTAGDISTRQIVSVSADASIEDALTSMTLHRIRRLVVVDDAKRLVGILTSDDIARNIKGMTAEIAKAYLSLVARG